MAEKFGFEAGSGRRPRDRNQGGGNAHGGSGKKRLSPSMGISTKSFLIELYREYLEEASFLYEQRLGLLHDPEVPWKRIGEFEERFEAHIDGLLVGGELALEVCLAQAE